MTAEHYGADIAGGAASVSTLPELGRLLRELKRREARSRGGRELAHRQIAARIGCSAVSVTYYLRGDVLPPIDRFDALVRCLGATPVEHAALATALDRIAEARRGGGATPPAQHRSAVAVPQSLPAPPPQFTGRAGQLAHLDNALTPATGAAAVVAISGMGGVGKTALALHWAHRSRHQFPDGQIFINLRGFDPREPLAVADALRELLIAVGVDARDIPPDIDDCTSRYHALLSGRRTLILFDNAADTAQVRPLLPPASCVALITSRDRLDDLVTTHGAYRVPLDVVTDEEAVALLRALIRDRCEREPDAIRHLSRLCGYLPLTLRVAAELVRSRPDVSLADLVGELASALGAGLDPFDTGDVRTNVRHVFSWSLRSLPRPAMHAFMLTGLVPGDTFNAPALASMADCGRAEAEHLLDTLHRAHLIQPAPRGRYGLHDLLRAFAVELANQELSPADQHTARHRLADYYLAAATAAMRTLYPDATVWPRSSPPPVGTPDVPSLSTVEAAGEWLATERTTLVRLGIEAASLGLPQHGVTLALTLRLFLNNQHSPDSLAVHAAALAAAEQLGDACDPADRAGLRVGLGIANLRLGRLDAADAHLQRAVAEHSDIGNDVGVLAGLMGLGATRMAQGRLHDAIEWMRRSLEVTRRAGRRVNEGGQLCNLASVHLTLEQYAEAAELSRAGIAILAEEGSTMWLAHGHSILAVALEGLGDDEAAMSHGNEALAIARATGYLEAEVQANAILATLDRRLGRLDEATQKLTAAVALARSSGRGNLIATVLNDLGETHLAAGATGPALACHVEALELADRTGERMQIAKALVGLGDTHARLGEDDDAADYWRQAEDAYAQMRHPAAERVRARLASLG